MPELNDDVVAAAVAGEEGALAAVYAALSPKVLAYLRARGAEDAEGLTNEVFLHVIRRLEGLVGGADGLRTFVFSVAHARFVDEVRRRARRPSEAPYHPELDHRSEPSAETAVLTGPRGGHLAEALSRLGEDQRSVVTLRVLGDLSLEQTAEVLGRSVGSVKQLQRRGLMTLRALVDRGEVAL
ncbi:MAG: RNA polymerase sigma factor [Nocardioidaceae bacterium]|nr:RNA polymerase sigma factor [Nocardioidaceae bacterium]NUS49698.1 RNA polymerase sigma factor [Nocardioidaceae bacterium]